MPPKSGRRIQVVSVGQLTEYRVGAAVSAIRSWTHDLFDSGKRYAAKSFSESQQRCLSYCGYGLYPIRLQVMAGRRSETEMTQPWLSCQPHRASEPTLGFVRIDSVQADAYETACR